MASDQGLLIAGEQQESSTGETYQDVNPYTGDAIATIAAASPADATRAIDAAAAAFKTWSQASPAERRAVFLRAAQLVRERTNDVVATTYLSARAVGIPLAVGDTVVLKATEEAPISAGFFLAELLRDAGLPAGVLNVITTPAANAEAVSRTLIDDPRVRRVNFTGSTRVGRKISEMAGTR